MNRGLFLVATVTLSSALYAQNPFTHEDAYEVFSHYNPVLLEKTAQDENLNRFVEDVLSQYVAQNLPDTLETRYTLVALVRNFENSLAVNAAMEQYKNALVYSQQGGNVQEAARAHARQMLTAVYPRIWAVSVQVKEDLLSKYKQLAHAPQLTADEKQTLQAAIKAVQADLKYLRTNIGEQLVALTQEALLQAEAQVAEVQLEQAQKAKETTNLHVKTNHKKPVAG